MKKKEYIRGIATSSFKGHEYNRCSRCKKIFNILDNVNTKCDEFNVHLCDECMEMED